MTKAPSLEAIEAEKLLYTRGYTHFRSGTIMAPKGHTPTAEEQSAFAVIKSEFPASRFIHD